MARNKNDLLCWGEIEKAIFKLHAGKVRAKFASIGDYNLTRSTIKETLYALEDVPSIGCWCHECEHLDTNPLMDWCLEHQRIVSPLNFCSYGKRKEK